MSGKVVLVTGAARGQGRSHAVAFAREGADIAFCDIAAQLPTVPYPLASVEDLDVTRDMIETLGRRCVARVTDVSRSAEMQEFVDQVLHAFGRIDVLIANAGIFSGGGPAWELTEDQWDEAIAVDLKGVWLSCKFVIPSMLSRGSGSLILISSMAGLEGYRNCAHYVAAKHGVIGLMRALANELGSSGIRVNAICPTTVNTASVNNAFIYGLFAGGKEGNVEDLRRGMKGINLLPISLIEPQDVTNAALWLASEAAVAVTGLALTIDAGAHVRFGA